MVRIIFHLKGLMSILISYKLLLDINEMNIIFFIKIQYLQNSSKLYNNNERRLKNLINCWWNYYVPPTIYSEEQIHILEMN
jgi:hypothetical protein